MNIFITVWNRHSWLIPFCEDCVKAGLTPILIDNASTYDPCVEWLKKCPYKVIWMEHNEGPWVFFTKLYSDYKDKYFFISDSDQDISKVPTDWPQHLISGLDRHTENKIWKAGLSQEINDIPKEDNHVLKEIYDYEKGFWRNQLSDGFYHVAMDLGVAVYDRERRTEDPKNTDQNGHCWYNAIRSDRPYTSRHLDWYLTKDNLREEDHYYFNAKNVHYGWGFKFYDEVYKK